MRRLADLAASHARLVIVLFALVTIALAVSASRTQTDNATDALYPDHSPVADLTRRIGETFDQHERLLVVLDGDIYTAGALDAIRKLTDELERIPGTTRVTSVATAKRLADDGGFLSVGDLVRPSSLGPADLQAVRDYLQTSPMYRNVALVSKDGRKASIVVEYRDGIDAAAFAKAVDRAVGGAWPGSYALAGQAYTSMELQAIIRRDLPVLAGIALALIVLMLFLNFRTVHGTLLPFVQIVVGVLWGMGLYHLLGGKLMALTVIGPIAVMAVGSSFSLHLLGRYYYELSRGADKRLAVRRMLSETGLGVLVSGLAISAAMSTFLLSDLAMVRGVGLIAALGVLSVLLASLVLLPALLCALPSPERVDDPERPGPLGAGLKTLAAFVARRRWRIMAGTALLLVVSLWGVTRIEANTSVLAFFPKDGPTRTSVAAVEKVLGGSSSITAWVRADIGDPRVLRDMERFQKEAAALPGVGSSQSIADVMRALNLTLVGRDALPSTRQAVAQELLLYQSSGDPKDLSRFMTLDGRQAIVTFITRSMSTGDSARLERQLAALAKSSFGDLAQVRFVGEPLMERDIERAMGHDFRISLTLAIALVLLIDSLVRSVRAAWVTILALVSTVALQYGLLGWLGLPLNLATMLMGALAIGVGDYAIHLTVRYMEERRRGSNPEAAIEHALFTSGRQIVFTALTLGAGFGALVFADFVPVSTLGALMVVTVALVGLSTLTLLPAVTLVAFRNPHARLQPPSEE